MYHISECVGRKNHAPAFHDGSLPQTMRFRVATYTYTLRMTEAPFMVDGVEHAALAEKRGRRITMSTDVQPQDRLTTLVHELRHCWGFHVPQPATHEEDCDLVGMICEAVIEDLQRQGGIEALEDLGAPGPMYFNVSGEYPVPVASTDDGAMTVEEAAAKLGWPVHALEALYQMVVGPGKRVAEVSEDVQAMEDKGKGAHHADANC